MAFEFFAGFLIDAFFIVKIVYVDGNNFGSSLRLIWNYSNC